MKTGTPFRILREAIQKTLQKKSFEDLFAGTDRFHQHDQNCLPGGVIIVKGSKIEIYHSNYQLVSTDDETEALGIFIAASKIFGSQVENAHQLLKKLLKL